MKLRQNNLRMTSKTNYKIRAISSGSNCRANVSEYAEYAVLVIYWIGNYMESNVRVCAARK